MKKVLHKLKEHTGTTHHAHHDREHAQEDDGLKASLYDETVPKAPPTIGDRPIKGDLHLDPSRTADASSTTGAPHHRPTSRTQDDARFDDAQTGLAMRSGVQPIEQRHAGYQPPPQKDQAMPTNFSRLSLGKSDGGARTRANMTERNLPPTPTTIQPQDLDSPEFSYLSKVYGRSNPDRSHSDVHPVERASPFRQTERPTQYVPDPNLNASGSPPSDQMAPSRPLGGSPSRTPAVPLPVSPSYREQAIPRKPLPEDVSRISARPESETLGDEETSAASRLSSVVDGDERPSLEGVLNVGKTVDTEVITEQAPAVVHEKIIPEVHHIREEKIEREIHTKDIIHRIQPIIDVEVLPPRHFVPDGHGGLREISADQLPGRQGHWGIVETVTKAPGEVTEQRPLPPSEPQIVSQRSYVTEDGIPRTETVWRHPPELATGGQETGQTWPMLVDPEAVEKRDGPLRAPHNLQRSAPIPFEPKPADPKSTETAYPIDESASYAASSGGVYNQNAAASSLPVSTGASTSMGPASGPADLNATPTRAEAPVGEMPRVPRRDPRGIKHTMPGAFPSLSSSTTATMKTFSERQQQ